MQKLTIIGNIGKDAEIFNHTNGQFLGFTVACTTRKKNGNELQETTNWYDCTTDNIKLLDYLKKGTKVYVEGRFKLSAYHSEQANKWIPKINLFASTLELLSAKKDDSATAQAQPQPQAEPTPIQEFELKGENKGDDLPF